MTNLTPELNLVQGEGDDDTADYLTIGLSDSLAILDGLFNQSTGHSHSGAHQGAILGPNAMADNSIPGSKLQDGTVNGAKLVDGSVTSAKLAPNQLESLYTNCLHNTSTNYTVVSASNIMYVWCGAAITVTLTAGINRPITVRANAGNSTVASTSGSVLGGSVDMASGTVINGRVNAGDALTYKWDGTNWAAV